MNKEELLNELSSKIRAGEISRGELLNRFGLASVPKKEGSNKSTKHSNFSITKILYVLGAAIVIIGIVIFIAQIWTDIGAFGRISVTLGLGLLITIIGSVLQKQHPSNNVISIGSVFHAIGGFLIPGGSIVALMELNVDSPTLWPVAITFGVIFLFYLLLNKVHKNAILTFFAIANGTVFIYTLIEAIMDGPFYMHDDLYAYLTMAMGISYLLLSHVFRNGWNKSLVRVLSFLGSAGFLGAAFTRVFDSFGWQLLFFLLVFGGIFLSIYMRSRVVLIVSTLFLLIHIVYITNEYFADSFGWPISLVILGFIFIGLGYASISIGRKYIR
ncbi:MAG: hypothetical protein U9P50_03025 [Patescibacteria group bacterium]|nr:hypothetical protein [Patescibacteria group bacterium]